MLSCLCNLTKSSVTIRQGAQPAHRKYTYAAASPGGCKVKWTAEEKPHGAGLSSGRRSLPPPNDVSFDHKWKLEPKSKPGAANKAKTKLEEANEDDRNKPAMKCTHIEEVLAGCDAIHKDDDYLMVIPYSHIFCPHVASSKAAPVIYHHKTCLGSKSPVTITLNSSL
ncbi:uncharacterized protein [Triticum aestivum]|uniref:uncharacterized protein isoform X3 n=1 Tax=Triticum aestivum TaxID=4565 RepID=UPI001D025F39|nr:uncharacterized protein LOC123102544 isoform X3 [Triticum aestivum]